MEFLIQKYNSECSNRLFMTRLIPIFDSAESPNSNLFPLLYVDVERQSSYPHALFPQSNRWAGSGFYKGQKIGQGEGDLLDIKLKPKGLGRSSGDNTEIVFVEAANSSSELLDVDILDQETFGRISTNNNITDSNPNDFLITPAYPNPFNPTVTIPLEVNIDSFISVNVYGLNGNLINEIVNKKLSKGNYQFYWDGMKYPSGIYILKINSNKYSHTQKIILQK